ncbi:MAG: phage protease [Myxococcota bacterium]
MFAVAHTSGRWIALRSQLPTISEDSARTWIHIAVEGRWEGHASGAFEFSRAIFDQIIRNFRDDPNPIPLTWGHPDCERAAVDGAAGWIHDLEIRSDGLWALTEFTEKAAGMVRRGEHRFCSVVVSFESIDRKTREPIGAELYEVGLVLSPFLSELTEIRLSRVGRDGTRRRSLAMSAKDVLEAALAELPKDATIEQAMALIEAEAQKQQALEGPAEPEAPETEASAEPPAVDVAAEDAPASDAPIVAAEGELGGALPPEVMAAVEQALAMMTPEELVSALGSLMSMPPADAESGAMLSKAAVAAVEAKLSVEKKQRVELSEKLAAVNTKVATLEVSLAIANGQLIEGQPYSKEQLVSLRSAAPDHFEALMKDGPNVPQNGVYEADKGTERAHAPSNSDEAVSLCSKELREKNPEWSKRKVRSESYKLAKARYPELIAGKSE